MIEENTGEVCRTYGEPFLADDERRRAIVEQYGPRNRFAVVEDTGPFESISLSEDGNTLAGASKNVLCLWNTRSYERVGRFVFGARVTHHSLSGDGQFLLVADENQVIHIVDVVFSAVTEVARHCEPILAVAVDAEVAVFGDRNGMVVVFDPTDYQTASILEVRDTIQALKLVPESNLLIVNIENTVMVYRLSDQKLLAQYGVHQVLPTPSDVPVVAALAQGRYGITAYDTTTGRSLCDVVVAAPNFDHTPDGSTIVTGADGHVALWDGVSGATIKRVRTFVQNIADVKVSADGSCFYVCGDGSSIEYFSSAGERMRSYSDVRCELMAAEVTRDNSCLVASDQRGVVTVYDLVSGSATPYFQHRCCISKQVLAGSLVATGGHDGFAKVLDLDSGETVFSVSCAGKPVQGIALDDDGYVVAGNLIGMIGLYDMTNGKLVREFYGNTAPVRCLRISACKRYLLSTADNGLVLVFDYRSGKLLNRLSEPAIVYSGDFDESGDFIYFGNGIGELANARSATADVIRRWRVHRSEVRSISITQGKLCSVSIIGDVHILDLQTGKTLLDCPLKTRPYRRIAFLNYDGTRFVTGGQDGRLTIRDSQTGSVMAELHHLGQGYLWATRGRSLADGGDCFWTDSEELIQVYSQTAGIESPMPVSSGSRSEFIAGHNNQTVTMSVVGLSPEARSAPLEKVTWHKYPAPALVLDAASA